MRRTEYIADRLGLEQIEHKVFKRRMPETPWYLGDGAALSMLLLIQILTGITMTLYYNNSVDFAWDSVQFITWSVPMGGLVRGMHYWSAGLMVVVMFIHVSRHLILGGYKAPREGTWSIGVVLFFLVFTMSYTGYILRWDIEALYAVGIALNLFYTIPLIGKNLVWFLLGGNQVSPMTLTRFYSIHIWIVPILLVAFVAYHLYLVIIHGVTHRGEWIHTISSAEEHRRIYKEFAMTEEKGQWFYPDAMLVSGLIAFGTFCIVFILALTAGAPELLPKANYIADAMPKEEWWFAWFSAIVALLPHALAPAIQVLGPLIVFALMLALPVFDRGPNRGMKRRPGWTTFVIFTAVAILWLTDLRMRSPWTGWPEPAPPPVPTNVRLSGEVEQGRILFAKYGCTSCHSVSSAGRSVGPDLAALKHRLSPSELTSYILAPEEGVAMPGYEGRMPPESLDKVVQYVLAAQTFPRARQE